MNHDRVVYFATLLGIFLFSEATATPAATTGYFDIRDFGAKGDGRTLDSAAINRAIEACAADGGGQVIFPPGKFLSGTIHLRSGVTLWLDAGSTLVGTTNLDEYQHFSPPADTPEGKFRGQWHRALMLGVGLENVAIVGEGRIDGNKVFDPRGEERMRGPHTILLGHCRKVSFRNFSVQDSANYAVLLEDCQEVEARQLRITGGWDGVHFRGWPGRPCRDVRIIGCEFYTGDDAIAGRYWEKVLIADCIINSSCNGIRLIGPASQLLVHDCLFYGPGVHPHRTSNRYNMLAGLCLQPGAWDATQGTLDEVVISDISMHRVTTPFHFSLKPGNTAGRITVSRVNATGVYRAAASVESWAEGPFTNLVFRDVSIEYEGGGTREQAGRAVKTPGVDARPLPAWGFYARKVQDLIFENVRVSALREDFRPVLLMDEIERLGLENFKFPRPPGSTAALQLTNTCELRIRDSDIPVVAPQYLGVTPVPTDSQGKFLPGKPYAVKVAVENGARAGVAKIELEAAGQRATRWLWFEPNQKREILFQELVAPGAAGAYELKAGGQIAKLRVE